jgi:hypothetical protein
MGITIAFLWSDNKILRDEVHTQKNNVSSLMQEVEEYSVSDSLNAASVTDLSLTLAEYKKYRAEDAELIDKMRTELKRMKSATAVQTQAVYVNTAVLSEDGRADSIDVGYKERTAEYGDEWHDISMLIKKDSVEYTLRTRESLLITNHVIPKRFLFFKFGCKEVRTDVLSRNPYTEKINVESIVIRK